jgi:endonuclease-3
MRPHPHPAEPAPPAAPAKRRRRPAASAATEARPALPDDAALREKALEVHRRLCGTYGCPIRYFHALDPVSELISSLLSHRTRNADSGRAFKALRARFPDWNALIEADTGEVEALIEGVRWPELKAPRLQEVLRALRERQDGELSLAFLAGMEVEAARRWLEALPGVGPKTSAAVLSFSVLRMPALPVDSHHHRVAQRLGLIGEKVDVGPSHPILRAQLPADWSAQALYDNHEILMLHGQKICHFRRPACDRCPLTDLCPSAFKA